MSEVIKTGMDYVRSSNDDQFVHTKYNYFSYESIEEEAFGLKPTPIAREEITLVRASTESFNYISGSAVLAIQAPIRIAVGGLTKAFTSTATNR